MGTEPRRERWPAHLPAGALRVVRWSARYEETVTFYRDTIGLPVLETFHDRYGLDGTILGLPAARFTWRSSVPGRHRTRAAGWTSWCSTCLIYRPGADAGQARRRGCPPGSPDRLLAGQRRCHLPGSGRPGSRVRTLHLDPARIVISAAARAVQCLSECPLTQLSAG